jgi:hypothetical protein
MKPVLTSNAPPLSPATLANEICCFDGQKRAMDPQLPSGTENQK